MGGFFTQKQDLNNPLWRLFKNKYQATAYLLHRASNFLVSRFSIKVVFLLFAVVYWSAQNLTCYSVPYRSPGSSNHSEHCQASCLVLNSCQIHHKSTRGCLTRITAEVKHNHSNDGENNTCINNYNIYVPGNMRLKLTILSKCSDYETKSL